MRTYEYSFLKEKHLNDILRLTNLVTGISVREEYQKLQYGNVFESLRKKAAVDSIVGSNAIEGIGTSDERIREIMEGGQPRTHDEIEISGYRDALDLIHRGHEHLHIDEDLIRRLHDTIEKGTGDPEAGEYKKSDNLIMEYLPDGNRRIRFSPVSHEDVPEAMKQLLFAYYDARQDAEIDPLLLTFCFILDFLCIHPFRGGNGRVSRLLTLLLLYQNGFDVGRYVSIEQMINHYKESYYESLMSSSAGWHENRNDYSPFLIFSLQILYRCYTKLNDSLGETVAKKAKKNQRIEAVVTNSLVPLSKMQIKDVLPDVSIRTIESQLSKLLKEGRIKKIGDYKNARYLRKE